jgi:hypothetical protein
MGEKATLRAARPLMPQPFLQSVVDVEKPMMTSPVHAVHDNCCQNTP